MALREDYEKMGQWLFKYRSYVPLVLIPFYLIVLYLERSNLHDFTHDPYWVLICFLTASIGIVIRFFAVGYSAPKTSGRNVKKQVADSVNKTGIYSLIRHPLYVGNSFIWLGIAMRLKLWWVVLLVMTYYWLYYEKIMFTEEDFLRRKFGEDYEEWANRTPTLIPNFKNYVRPAGKFSWKKLIRKENDGVYALIMNLFLLDLFADWIHDKQIEISDFWIIFFTSTTLLYILVKIIKKKTCWLKCVSIVR